MDRIIKNAHLVLMTFAILLFLSSLILPRMVSGAPQTETPSNANGTEVGRSGKTTAEPAQPASANAGTLEQRLKRIKETTGEKHLQGSMEKTGKPSESRFPHELNGIYFKKTFLQKPPSLNIFGHRLFSRATTFSSISDLSVPDDYLIGPGDEIRVITWGRMDSSESHKVDNSGMVMLPKVGQITVGRLTFKEVEDLIKSRLGAISGVNVSVSMGKLRPIQLFVLGEVKAPGAYTVKAPATALNVLYASAARLH